MTDQEKSLALLCADAIAFTPEISERHREIVVGALRHVATRVVTTEDERGYLQSMLDAGMQTTAGYNPALGAAAAALVQKEPDA